MAGDDKNLVSVFKYIITKVGYIYDITKRIYTQMPKPKHLLTPEELFNNYEYKLVVKALKREFKWITNVTVEEEEKINNYNLIFIDITINPYIVMEEYGWGLQSWTILDIERKQSYYSPYLSTIFITSYEDGRDVNQTIDTFMSQIHQSPALPKELKLPEGRKFSVGGYRVPANQMELYGPIPTQVDDQTPEDTQ
jgi:hypothetical protein